MRTVILAFGLMVAFAAPAAAQGAGMASPGAAAANPTARRPLSSDSRVVGSAPIGHRQPTASEVPKEDPYGESAEDKALDRKIKSICRGC
jgi:hypothetical protein